MKSLEECIASINKLSQEELDYLANKYNNTTKFEESKIRHKKTPAISIKNNNFLETIKGFNYSSRNDNSKKIKYPKHEASQNSNMVGFSFKLIAILGITKHKHNRPASQHAHEPPRE